MGQAGKGAKDSTSERGGKTNKEWPLLYNYAKLTLRRIWYYSCYSRNTPKGLQESWGVTPELHPSNSEKDCVLLQNYTQLIPGVDTFFQVNFNVLIFTASQIISQAMIGYGFSGSRFLF